MCLPIARRISKNKGTPWKIVVTDLKMRLVDDRIFTLHVDTVNAEKSKLEYLQLQLSPDSMLHVQKQWKRN